LSSCCSLVLVCFGFTLKPLALTSIFRWSFNTIRQSCKQALLVLLLSLIIAPFLNLPKGVVGHLKSHVRRNDHQSHIDDDVQLITANIFQGWIRELNLNFCRANPGEQLEESYT
jgi:hypothetical protein